MDALLFVPVAIAISLTPGPNNFCGLNNGIRAGVGAALVHGGACGGVCDFFVHFGRGPGRHAAGL